MYDNIGGKIKTVAVFGCIIGIIASVMAGFSLIVNSGYYNPTATTGWIILIVGSLASWLGSFTMYGFGELIEKTCENNEILQRMEKQTPASKKEVPAAKEETVQVRAETVSPAAETKESKAEFAAPAPEPDNRTNDVTDDTLQQVKNMATAVEIYNYIVLKVNNAALLNHLERNAKLEKAAYGNYKSESIASIEGYIKHGHKSFPVDRSGRKTICPVCGCEQKSDRSTCKSCSALFEISKV